MENKQPQAEWARFLMREKPAVHLIINAEAFEIRHTHRNSINARLKVSRGFCRGERPYLGELRVILINSVGGRDDGAAHRLLQGARLTFLYLVLPEAAALRRRSIVSFLQLRIN